MMEQDDAETVMWQGRFITAKTRGKWEYVSRARGIKAAVILAMEADYVLLVEQYRVPLGANCI
jgi:ADP-ribose pyrophosphatase